MVANQTLRPLRVRSMAGLPSYVTLFSASTGSMSNDRRRTLSLTTSR